MSVVVLAPHADDETLSCGGTIAKFVEAGREVFVYLFSSGLSNTSEFNSACSHLKATAHAFPHFKSRVFSSSRQDILECMVEINRQLKPSIVFCPASSDCHQDHRVIYEEAKRAFKHSTIYGWESPWNSFDFSNTCYVRLSPDHITAKIQAMKQYESQKERIYFKEYNIISVARVRGMQAGCEYAECFEVIRQYL